VPRAEHEAAYYRRQETPAALAALTQRDLRRIRGGSLLITGCFISHSGLARSRFHSHIRASPCSPSRAQSEAGIQPRKRMQRLARDLEEFTFVRLALTPDAAAGSRQLAG
jgi:hypothetical protein